MKHHISPRKVSEIDIKSSMEKYVYNVKREDPESLTQSTCESIRHATIKFINACKQACRSRMNKGQHQTPKELQKDDSIKVCNFDKGNGVVILDSEDYFSKLIP